MFSFVKRISDNIHERKNRNLKEKGIRYVRENFGEEYVDEFRENYDKINNGEPIGNYATTVVFLNLLEDIRNS